jgi:hypothetical protein
MAQSSNADASPSSKGTTRCTALTSNSTPHRRQQRRPHRAPRTRFSEGDIHLQGLVLDHRRRHRGPDTDPVARCSLAASATREDRSRQSMRESNYIRAPVGSCDWGTIMKAPIWSVSNADRRFKRTFPKYFQKGLTCPLSVAYSMYVI